MKTEHRIVSHNDAIAFEDAVQTFMRVGWRAVPGTHVATITVDKLTNEYAYYGIVLEREVEDVQ